MKRLSPGRESELSIARLFSAAGFEVMDNPKSAKPRQSDLFAREGNVDFLIEVKNRKKKIDVSDIDALRSRLARVASDIVGIIFTTSALTLRAIEAIEADRHREIIIFIEDEVDRVRSGGQNLRALIERKRTALRVQGKAWFSKKNDLEFLATALPSGNVEFRIGESVVSHFEAKSVFSGVLYALNIPDTGWSSVTGEGGRLSIQLALGSVLELRDVLGYLHKKFGLSGNGVFSIQQSECGWCGVGAEDFVVAVEKWHERYERSSATKFHHSEELRYFDEFRNGWLELSAQQRVFLDVSRDSAIHQSELVIQFPGIPVDMTPFVKLCQYVGNEWAEFRYFTDRLTFKIQLKKSLPIEFVGVAVEKLNRQEDIGLPRPTVVGVVGKNPFYKKKSLPPELESSGIPIRELIETELILCSLRDWHEEGDLVDRYELQGIEITMGASGSIIRPFGTWNKMLKRRARR